MSKQMEDDLDRQFRDKLVAAMRHLDAMYEVAGLNTSKASAAAATECLRFAIWLVTKGSNIPREEFLDLVGSLFDSARGFQKRK